MRVYVDTNFLLELILKQEQCESCEKMLTFCEAGSSSLAMSSFCAPEAYHTLDRHRLRRNRMLPELTNEITQLARSAAYRDRTKELKALGALLTGRSDLEEAHFHECIDRTFRVATVIPLDLPVLTAAFGMQRTGLLGFFDSIVLASVLTDLERYPGAKSCFLSRDRRFNDPAVRDLLEVKGCKVLASFDAGLNFVMKE
jgi:predicted nucleic acid-binding protein